MARKKTKSLDELSAEYTHSAWSGEAYERPQTHAELVAEGMRALRSHPTIGKCLIGAKS